jgi:hypothetical protein
LNATDAEVRRVAQVLARQNDEQLLYRFLTLGSLRYDREQLKEMLGASKMGLIQAILEGSSLVKEERDKAREEGLERGREEGRTGEARRLLRIVLKSRFPGLEQMTEIEAISPTETMESLLTMAITSTERRSVERAIAAAARPV